MIVFHVHKGSVRIRFGIAVPFSTGPELFLILFQLADNRVKVLYVMLQYTLAAATSVYHFNFIPDCFIPQAFQKFIQDWNADFVIAFF